MKLVVLIAVLVLSGCSATPEQQLYQQRLAAENPRTLLLQIEATEQIPPEVLSAAYSLLPELVEDELGLTVLNTETEQQVTADAVMKVRLTDWHASSDLLYQSDSLAADYQLVSSKSGQLLWQHHEDITKLNMFMGRGLMEEAVYAVLRDLDSEPARMVYYLNKYALAEFP